jgi:5-amino-6-(5-phosphoribosylamino)uracil reductase
VPDRPYVIASCAISVDGCLDDTSPRRLILSGPDDLDEVDELRASVDAILIGAGTIRADNPRLLVRSPARVAARVARGQPEHPLRVTLTASGDLDPAASFFTGPGTPLAYQGASLTLRTVLHDLHTQRDVATVLIEGGARVLAEALSQSLADELRLAIAPFIVGDPDAPRFARPDQYPYTKASPMRLLAARRLGDVVVLHYQLSHRKRSLPRPAPPVPGVSPALPSCCGVR